MIHENIINNKKIFSFVNENDFIDFIINKKKILIALNAEKLLNSDEILKHIINKNIGYPDGIGAVYALRKKGIKSIRLAGADLWLKIIEASYTNKSFYFIGSTQDVIIKTINKLKEHYNNINIKGYHNGYLDEENIAKLIDEIKEKRPDIVFVAMGSPRQEYVMDQWIQEYPALYMGLGGSFDVYTGEKKRAPAIFQKYNLEWFYRLLKEPTRIKRQIRLVKFLFLIIRGKL